MQHDWAVGDLAGVHHVTLPVSDVARSRDWYAHALGFVVMHDAIDGAEEVTMVHPGTAIKVALRHDPPRAQALAGFDAIAFTVATIDDLDSLVARLDAHGVAHSAPTPSSTEVSVDIADPTDWSCG